MRSGRHESFGARWIRCTASGYSAVTLPALPGSAFSWTERPGPDDPTVKEIEPQPPTHEGGADTQHSTGRAMRAKNRVPAMDIAGTVEAVGDEVTQFIPGMRSSARTKARSPSRNLADR